jgi:hypothetical protein
MNKKIFYDKIVSGAYIAQINDYWQRHNIIDDSPDNLLPCGYLMGYKQAADSLLDSLSSNDTRLDYFVFPIVFLYRQYLELLLKRIYINRHNVDKQISLIKDVKHNLTKIYDAVRDDVGDLLANNQELLEQLKSLIDEFSERDLLSFNFRYDFDNKMQDNFSKPMSVDLMRLKKVIESIDTAFCGEYN